MTMKNRINPGVPASPRTRQRLRPLRILAAWAALSMLPLAAAGASPAKADVVLRNGSVYTVNPSQPTAQAVAIRDGKIMYVGSTDGAKSVTGSATRVVDLGGRMLLPGFVDTHNHAYLRAEEMFWVSLSSADLGAYRTASQAFLAQHPGAAQLRGVGFSLPYVLAQAASSGRSPTQLLDEIVGKDIPAVILTAGHHELWANSKAMRNAGIDKNTPNPPGGFIDRDPVSGEPTGILRETGAHNLVLRKLPQPDFTVNEFRQSILSFQSELAPPRGVTSVLMPVHYRTDNLLEALQTLDNENRLNMRFDVLQWADETRGSAQVPEFAERRAKFKGKYFKLDSVKIFGTGASSTYGSVVWDQEVLKSTVAALDKAGFRVYIHDIGPTRTYALMLDALEFARQQNGPRDARHMITHVSKAAAPLIDRFKALGVRADGHPAPTAFFDGGVATTSSSDYPVRDFHPLARIAAGVGSGVALDKMIASHTIRGAEAIFAERETGSIEVGKAADIVILERDLFAVAPAQIGAGKVVMTLFDGKAVFRDPSFSGAKVLLKAASVPLKPVVLGPVTEDPDD